MGSVYGALHTQTRQLVEPSRDRDQPVQPWVPGASQDSIAPRSEPRSASMEPENESRSRRHQLEVHTRKSPPEVRLQKEQIQVVTDPSGIHRTLLYPLPGDGAGLREVAIV